MTDYETCSQCGEDILKIVTPGYRIVDFEIAGRCPECAAEDGMSLDETINAFSAAMEELGKHSYKLQ